MANRSVTYTNTLQEFWQTYNLTAIDVGDIANLSTTATDLVTGVNEVHDERDALDTRVGALTSMDAAYRAADVTQSVEAFYDAYVAWTGSGTALDTTATNLAAAVNEVHTDYNGLNTWVGTRTLTFSGGVISATTIQEGIQDVWEDYYSFLGRGVAFTTTATTVLGAINEIESNHNALDSRVGALASMDVAYRQSDVTASVEAFYDDYVSWTGFGTTLTTTATDLAGAVNEIESNHNSLDTRVGALATLNNDIEGASIVASINLLDVKFENWTGHGTVLTTAATDLAGAVNEIESNHNALDTRVGALTAMDAAYRAADVTQSVEAFYDDYVALTGFGTSLDTTATNIIAAVNELHGEINSNDTDIATINTNIGTLSGINDAIEGASVVATFNNFYTAYAARTDVGTALLTTAQTLGDAINELHGAPPVTEGDRDTATVNALHARVGLLSNLDADFTGANDDSIVAAINYIYNLQTGATQNFTNAVLGGTLDVTGLSTFSGGVVIDGGTFTSLGIDDNATAERVQIDNSLITLRTAVTAESTIAATGDITTSADFVVPTTGSLHNNAGERVDFDSNSVLLVASSATVADFTSTGITFYEQLTLSGGGITVPTGQTITINGSEIFHSGNMGAGSGLDADLFDGLNSSSFARTDTASETFGGDLVVTGNLTVNGTTTTVNSETLSIADNVVVLNSDVTGTPSENAGIEIERGTSNNVLIRWNETSDVWQLTSNGSNYYEILTTNSTVDADTLEGETGVYYLNLANAIGSTSDISEGTNLYYTNARARAAISVSGDLSYNSGTGVVSFSETYSSASELLTALLTVDGVGSGLDAEYLAGNDSAYYRNASNINAGTLASARLPDLVVADFSAAAIQLGSEAFVDSETVLMTAAAIQDKIESYGYTTNVGDITNVTAGTGLSGGGASGSVTLNVTLTGLDTDDLAEGTNLYYTTARANTAIDARVTKAFVDALLVDAATLDGIDSTGFALASHTHSAGDITSGTLASARLPDLVVADFAGAAIQTGIEAFVDSDTVLMTAAAIQDKIESYGYTTNVGDITGITAGNGLTGGGTSGSVTLNIGAGTGITVNSNDIAVNMAAFSTSNLSEGTNLYYTTARANTAIDARVTKAFVDALAVNAGQVDGIEGANLLRSDVADTAAGKITFTAGARFNDNGIIELGSSADAEIFHNGIDAYIDLNLGNLYVRDGTVTRYTFDDNGDFTATGDLTAYSDPRLKTLESQILNSGDILDNVIPYYYRWNDKAKKIGLDDERRKAGVLTTDVKKHMPEALSRKTEGSEEYEKVNYEAFIPVLMAEIRDLRKRVAELEEANG